MGKNLCFFVRPEAYEPALPGRVNCLKALVQPVLQKKQVKVIAQVAFGSHPC
jgi:hypothetical protein